MSRDADGRTTLRAILLDVPIKLDGRLDEPVYRDIPAISDFIQTEPAAGAPATEKTEAWITFDADNLYLSFRCWESHPERMIVNEMRRDSNIVVDNDNVSFILDTFHDKRNSAYFALTPIGGRLDGQLTGLQYNPDWNPIWDFALGRFEGGWTAEIAVPFKSLRYRPGAEQTWGIILQRTNRWKNELSFVTKLGNSLGPRAISQTDQAATLTGLRVPSGSRNLEIKPYVIGSLTSDAAARPRVSNDPGGDVGADVKYGLTQNLTADLTYNTDFAQVEADEQQVNLTRFNLFFPEKRDFFLENAGTFVFGVGGASSGATVSPSTEMPVLFYSRRIGLQQGREVPILGGGRLTGRVRGFTIGLLNIQTGDEPAIGAPSGNMSVARVKRDILRRSSVGAIVTSRSRRETGAGSNQAYGVDGTFNFFTNLSINTYWARTHTDDLTGDDTSYRGQLDYAGDRYTVQLEHLRVGDDFNPELGFLRRDDIRKSYGQFKFSPRPAGFPSVRKFYGTTSIAYVENGAGRRDFQDALIEGGIEYQNGDKFSAAYNDTFELLPRPFTISSGVIVPAGGYTYRNGKISYALGRQRALSGTMNVEYGSFYNGEKTTVAFSRGRIEVSSRISLEPNVSINWIDLEQGRFTNRLVGSRATYTLTPRMFVSALVQYASATNSVATNARLRWEYQPGSELFVVYNEQRDTIPAGVPELQNRAFIVKINRLFRF